MLKKNFSLDMTVRYILSLASTSSGVNSTDCSASTAPSTIRNSPRSPPRVASVSMVSVDGLLQDAQHTHSAPIVLLVVLIVHVASLLFHVLVGQSHQHQLPTTPGVVMCMLCVLRAAPGMPGVGLGKEERRRHQNHVQHPLPKASPC